MKFLKSIFFLGSILPSAFSQTTPDDAVRAALQNHPLTQAAAFEVKAKTYREKASLNLPNPEVNAESPTGEFYTIGVLQSFEFPTVYARHKQLAKAETALARAGQRVSENDLQYTVRSLYLEAQVAEYQNRQWAVRDSLYQAISTAAIRQFASGEIDFLQKTMAENEAGKVHLEHLAAEQTALVIRQQLAGFTGISDLGLLLMLEADTLGLIAVSNMGSNPAVTYQQQAAQVAERQIQLAKSKALPNFSLGYLNQGERNTPIDYRFRASIGVPLWAGQYRAGVSAAKAESQASLARVEAQGQAVKLESQRTQSEAATVLLKIHYYQNEALPRSQDMILAATRLREAGQVDYVTFLRTLDEAFTIRHEYVEQLQALNAAQLHLRYLAGN